MNKVTKYALLFLLMIPFMLVESIYIILLSVSVLFGWLAKPLKKLSELIIDKANDINIK
jgi:ABC-type microcin C transport system permease subunit YejE